MVNSCYPPQIPFFIEAPRENQHGWGMTKIYKHLFGPVPSRRLGRSLGIDLVPLKTCTLDCIYCQLGETPVPVSRRDDYVPVADVKRELELWLESGGEADHITLAGSGEPTLHSGFGRVLAWIRGNTNIPSVLLTNGTLLHLPEVRRDAALADKVKVTLSAWDEESFRKLHRPVEGIGFEKLFAGERAFREIFTGELSVEVFIVEGINSGENDVRKIAERVALLAPDRIDLNTAVRPAALETVSAVSEERLSGLAALFGDKASVTATFRRAPLPQTELSADALLGLIRRHPATADQLVREFNASAEGVLNLLDDCVREDRLSRQERNGEVYYCVRDQRSGVQ
jgi:wyosine [tRNA(Phe)-imidazoG37] synthetase (radical SAM superfamily)